MATIRKTKVGKSIAGQSKEVNTQGEVLTLRYIALGEVRQWERNPKKHDVGAIWKSIQQHGFKDPPKYEPKLNGGGGIVEGNGRSHVLAEMQRAGEAPPRGITATKEDWLIPVLFGVDAASERAAEAYGVDHNNLVLSGGDFSAFDISKLWDETAYAALLTDLAQFEALPMSVDGDDVDALIQQLANPPAPSRSSSGDYDSFEQDQKIMKSSKGESLKNDYGVIVICQGESDQQETCKRLRDEGYDCRIVST